MPSCLLMDHPFSLGQFQYTPICIEYKYKFYKNFPRSGPFTPAVKAKAALIYPSSFRLRSMQAFCLHPFQLPPHANNVGAFAPNSHSRKSSSTSTSINSCNLDNLLSFVRNAFAPKERLAATCNASGGETLYLARNCAAARATFRSTSTMDKLGK